MSNGFNLFGNTPPVSRNVGEQIHSAPVPGQQVPATGLNFTGMQNAVAIHSQTQSAQSLQYVTLAACAVLSQASGLFQYDVDVAFADDTTAKTVRLRVVLFPAGPLVKGPGGPEFPGFTQSAGSPSAVGRVSGPAYDVVEPVAQLTQDAMSLTANGLLLGPIATGLLSLETLTLWDQEVDTLSGELSNGDGAFHAHGRCGFGVGVPADGFGPGNWAILALQLVIPSTGEGTNIVTFGSCSMGLTEVG